MECTYTTPKAPIAMSTADESFEGQSPSLSATAAMLYTMSKLLHGDRRVPARVDSPQASRMLSCIHAEQAESGFRHLRSRYHKSSVAAREFHIATVQATSWIDGLVDNAAGRDPGHDLARLTAIACLTRRLIIDGSEQARRCIASCRTGLHRITSSKAASAGPALRVSGRQAQ